MELNNEVIGISAEIAIADVFNVHIDDNYRKRGNKIIVEILKPIVEKAFNDYKLPKPEKHIAEDQSPIDFILQNGKTLSVKTNQKSIGKVAPQKLDNLQVRHTLNISKTSLETTSLQI